MTRSTSYPLRRSLEWVRKCALSVGAGWLLLILASGALRLRSATTDSPAPSAATSERELGKTREAVPSAPAPLLFDGLPMATETLAMGGAEGPPCDLILWTPEASSLWSESSFLLHLDRGAERLTASWIETIDTETFASFDAERRQGILHGVQLSCEASGRGRLFHTYTTRPLSVDDRAALGRPVTERTGPVPLLGDTVQLAAVRNLEWTLFIDQPADPSTAVERLHRAMEKQGWRSKTPEPHLLAPLDLPRPDLDGGVWIRDGALCLAARSTSEGRDLLVSACRGLLSLSGGA